MFKGRQSDRSVNLLCVRRRLAYGLSLRDLEEMMAERNVAVDPHGRPDRVVIDGSRTNHEAIVSCDASDRLRVKAPAPSQSISIRKHEHLNNRIGQDRRRIKRRVRPMLRFKSFATAEIILDGIERAQTMRKRQARFAFNPNPSLAEQFANLAAGSKTSPRHNALDEKFAAQPRFIVSPAPRRRAAVRACAGRSGSARPPRVYRGYRGYTPRASIAI
jgi:hypothetical protein